MQHSQGEHAARELTIGALADACLRETARWRYNEASDTQFCLEIFRRALLRSDAVFVDEPARETLVTIYTSHIRANISRKAFPHAPGDDMVQQVWLRFWQAATNGSLEFRSLEAALGYLRMVTVSTVIEARKLEWRHQRELALVDLTAGEEAGDQSPLAMSALRANPADEPFNALQRARFRERCRELIQDPLSYRIFWLRYSMGLPPREIARQLADSGTRLRDRTPTPRAVSDLIDQVMKQLAADLEIRDLLQSD
ncbi:sigma-70 family RNA polymerase sigma factor [Chloroflexales bacterium ZM16-3]|nr:sigma-70 family RNA polymerase sigma factor [Chloroflexales bacterium ZM16-3]